MLHRSPPKQDAAFYQRYFGALVDVAVSKFSVPQDVAEEMADDILLASLRKLRHISDVQGFLLGAVTSAAKHYAEEHSE